MKPISEKRLTSLLSAKGMLLNMGWNLGSPSVVLAYMAIAHDVPIFLAGMMVTFRRVANMVVDLFGATFIETRRNRAIAVASTEIGLAVCILAAVAAIATGSLTVVMIAIVVTMFGLGIASELQNIMYNDFLGQSLASDTRTSVGYWSIGLSGIGTILLVWPLHLLMHEQPTVVRHATVVLLACTFFLASALLMFVIGRRVLAAIRELPEVEARKGSFRREIESLVSNYRSLASAIWFRRYMTVIVLLQSIELSLPFFAILAALTSDHSARGVTALIISSALALTVSGFLWRLLSLRSHRTVLVTASLMGALSCLSLVVNHFFHLVNATALYAVALFVATVAAYGSMNARSLYYLDIAPEADRVPGLTVSNTIIRSFAVGITAVLAAIAHMQHVVWAILIIAIINLVTALACITMVSGRKPTTQPVS